MSPTSMPGDGALRPRMTLRRAWLVAHRWLGLAVAAVLVLAGLTGALLVALEPVDEAVNERLFAVADPGPLALGPALDTLRADFPPGTPFVLRPPRAPGESLQVFARGDWKGTVFLHPSTGEELGRRSEDEGFFNFLFVLHTSLFAGDTGKAVLTLAALGYLLMLLSGLILWWPRSWRAGLSVRIDRGATPALLDLHRVGGAVFGLVVAVSVMSGAYMAWHPIARWVSAAMGQAQSSAPAVPARAGERLPLDRIVARAQAVFPAGMVGYVQVPGSDVSPVRVRLRLPDDPHPNGLTSVWLHPRSGEVLAAHRWTELDLGTRAYSFIYPLHVGELGGTPVLVATLVAGLLLVGFGVSGCWIWWSRRSRRAPTPLHAGAGRRSRQAVQRP